MLFVRVVTLYLVEDQDGLEVRVLSEESEDVDVYLLPGVLVDRI